MSVCGENHNPNFAMQQFYLLHLCLTDQDVKKGLFNGSYTLQMHLNSSAPQSLGNELKMTQSISDGCCVLIMCPAHLSLAVGLHEFDERRVSFDLELHYRSILTCYLQVYVFIVFCLHCFLRDRGRKKKKTVIKGTQLINQLVDQHRKYRHALNFVNRKYKIRICW